MVVDHAAGLHKGVDDGGAYEGHASFLEVFAEGGRYGRFGLHFAHRWPVGLERASVYERPEVGVESAELFLDFQYDVRVFDGGVYFEFVADDARIFEQFGDFFGSVVGNLFDIEVIECYPVRGSPFEDGLPAEACLCAFEGEEFEQVSVVVDSHSPFVVVVRLVYGATGAEAPDGIAVLLVGICGHG